MRDVIAERGRAAVASLEKKLEKLEAERGKLEESEARLKKELEAEKCQVPDAQEQVRLSLSRQLIDLNRDHPERIKAMLPRFIDYVVWTEENGAGTSIWPSSPRLFLSSEDTPLKAMLAQPERRPKLLEYLRAHPTFGDLYVFKQRLCRLLGTKERTKRQFRRLIPYFLRAIERLRQIGIKPLLQSAETFES